MPVFQPASAGNAASSGHWFGACSGVLSAQCTCDAEHDDYFGEFCSR